MKIAMIQPRTSYYIGGAEVISMEHAKMAARAGYEVDFYTSSPKSFGEKCSARYLDFRKEHSREINIIELDQPKEFSGMAKIMPGENKTRWFVESMFFARSLSCYMNVTARKYEIAISYFAFDGMFISKDQTDKNVLYLLGNPSNESDFRETQLAMYDKIIAVSPRVCEFWQKYTDKNISVVATGVDFARFYSLKNSGSRTLRAVFVGRLI